MALHKPAVTLKSRSRGAHTPTRSDLLRIVERAIWLSLFCICW